MILADTSIWVDHFRSGNDRLRSLLDQFSIVLHPFIISELALGNFRNRDGVIGHLKNLPAAPRAGDEEVLYFIEQNRLMGRGISYVDAHLLASAALAEGVRIWTLDRRLADAARALGLSAETGEM